MNKEAESKLNTEEEERSYRLSDWAEKMDTLPG